MCGSARLRRFRPEPGELPLAWVLANGEDLVPMPGTKRRKCLEEGVLAAEIKLTMVNTKLLVKRFDSLTVFDFVGGKEFADKVWWDISLLPSSE